MKLKQGFLTHTVGEEQVLIGVGSVAFSGLIRSNQTAAFIIDALKEETTLEEIVETLFLRYDAEKSVLQENVEKVLQVLREVNALEE